MKRSWNFKKWIRNLSLVSMLACGPTQLIAGERFAVLVGIDRYAEDSRLAPLKYAANDMERLREILLQRGYDKENILALLTNDSNDAKPTREKVVGALNSFFESHPMSSEDSIMVVFAGHGFNSNGDSYLCPVDYQASSPEASSIRVGELANLLAENQAGEKYVVIDACRNETILDADREFNLVSGLRKMRLRKESKSQGIMFFSSCLAGQLSYEDSTLGHGSKKGSGVFMNFFVDGLEGAADVAGNSDGTVTAFELSAYVSKMTNAYVNKVFDTNQRPWADSHSTADMTLCQIPKETYEVRKAEWGWVERLSGLELITREQAEDEIFDAVKFLAGGLRAQAMVRVTRAIKIDEKYYFSRRLRSLLYILEGNSNSAIAVQNYEKAIEDLAAVGSQLRMRIPDSVGEIPLRSVTEVLATAKPGDVLLVNKIVKESGVNWLQVTGIRRNLTLQNRSHEVEKIPNYSFAFVDLKTLATEATSKAMIEDYSRPVKPMESEFVRTQQPQSTFSDYNRQQPQFSGQRLEKVANAVELYNTGASIANIAGANLPTVSIPSIPYVGNILSRLR